MPGLNVTSPTLVTASQPYPSSVAQLAEKVRVSGLRDVATALLALQKTTEDINRILRQSPPQITEFTVTDADGNLVARLGDLPTADGRTFYGIQGLSLYVGDVLGNRDPADAPFYSDPQGHVYIGKNGWLDVLDPYGNDAAWLGTQFDVFTVTGAVSNGGPNLIRLTVTGHTLLTGDIARVLNVGGVPNAMGLFTVTKIDANHIDLQGSVFAGTFTAGGTVDRLLHVTGAANNGAGLIRLTIVAHGYESGDQVNVLSVSGVPNATAQWVITVIDSSHIDLVGSTWAGAYVSGGLALRYFAGGLFENFAIGPSFPNYKLRGFPDGSLRIRNALITLVGTGLGSATITLDPGMGTITIEANAPSTVETLLKATGIEVGGTTAHDSRVYINRGLIALWDDVTAGVPTGANIRIEPQKIELSDLSPTVTISLAGPTGAIGGLELDISGALINISREASNFASMDSAVYKVSGTPGLGRIQGYITGFTFTYGNFMSFPSGTSAPAVVGLATLGVDVLTFDSGILLTAT